MILSGSIRTVAEHEETTSPRICVRNFYVIGIARSNFEPVVNMNPSIAIFNFIETIDVANVCNGVNVSVVALRGVTGKRLQASASTRAHHMLAGCTIASEAGGLRGGGSLSTTALQLITIYTGKRWDVSRAYACAAGATAVGHMHMQSHNIRWLYLLVLLMLSRLPSIHRCQHHRSQEGEAHG